MTAKYFNVKNGLTTGTISLSAANGNITSNTYIGNVVVTNTANLGAVGNITITGGTAGYVLSTNGGGVLDWVAQTGGGGGGSPGGINTYVQFNDSSTFGGISQFTYNKATDVLTVGNITANGAGITYITGSNVSGNVTSAVQSHYANIANSVAGSNVDGQVGNALVAGTVYTNAQPNITSVGTLASLDVTANITSGNADLGNLATASYFSGNGIFISNIAGANVSGIVANATYATSAGTAGSATTAGTVTTNAQPNITSVGTLASLDVTANITSGNASLGNLVTATYFSGNGSLLTYITGSNINGNVTSAVQSHYANIANSVAGSNVNGNVTSAIQSHYANIANSVAGSNVSGQVGNALVAGTVYTNAQPNITSVGTLASLSVSGDATVTGNFTVGGNTTYINVETFRVEDPIIELGGGVNGAALTSNDGKDRGTILHYYTTDVVDAFMGWDNSNGEFAFGSNVSVSSEVVTFNNFGNVRASYFIGNGSTLTYITGSNVSGNVTSAVQSHYANIANSVAGGNVSGQVGNALVAGTVYTNAQPNITSLGTLAGLTSTGVINLTGTSNVALGVVGNVHITGGADGQILTTDGTGNLQWVDNSPSTVTYLANSIALTNGVYVTGNLYSVQVFGDYAEPDGVYTLTDGTGAAPAWIFDADYTSVTNFNRVVMNINYTASSGHTIYVQLYNYTTSFTLASGTVTTTTGTNIVTVSSTTNMAVGQTIKFGTSVGGLTAGTAYYIISIPTSGQLTVGTGTGSGTTVSLSTDSQTSTVEIQNWDNIGTYTGLGSYYAFALQVIDDAAYISSGIVKLRLFHSNQGSASHTTNIDYLALELSTQGPQGPRGPTGATGATGATGNGVASGGTTGQVLIKNSGSNYDTAWSSSLTSLTTITATGNITSGNADLGNLATANYFSGNGIFISNIAGANVSGTVANATYATTAGSATSATTAATVTTNAQPNITSVGSLASLTVSGLITATGTGIKTSNVQDSSGTITIVTGYGSVSGAVGVYGNITAGTSGTGFFVGNGSYLSGLAGGNVSGQVGNALVAGTVYTNAQPNITSVGSLSGLTVSNATGVVNFTTTANVTLGSVSNLHISGGSANYVLQTDGSGTLSWAASGGGSPTITDNTSTNATYYPVYATASSGSLSTAGVSSTKLQFNPSLGQLTVTDLNSLSDATLKTNWQTIDDPFSILDQLFGMGFEWTDNGRKSYGLSAQNVESILPELVGTTAQGKKTVNYIPIIAFLLEALKKNNKELQEIRNSIKPKRQSTKKDK